MNQFKLFLSALMILVSGLAIAGGHEVSYIEGNGINLILNDHSIGGTIKDFIVTGHLNVKESASKLIMRKDGQLIEADFTKTEQRLGGVIHHSTKSDNYTTILEVSEILPDQNKIVIKANNVEIPVTIQADKFENNHFYNPTYTTQFEGETISFQIIGGQACYNFSSHLLLMIVGAYIH